VSSATAACGVTGRVAVLCLASAAACLDAPPGSLPMSDGDGGGPPPTVLVSAYGFDPPDPLADSSGNGNDAHCSGSECPTWITDRNNDRQAALFDGVDDLLSLASIGSGPFTVMAWVRMDDGAGLKCPINRPLAGSVYDAYQLCMRVPAADTGRVLFYTDEEPRQLFVDVAMELASWHHIAIRWDGFQKTISWDGVDRVTSPGTTRFDESGIRLGSDLDMGAVIAPFIGALDSVEIWQGALSEEEVAAAAGR